MYKFNFRSQEFCIFKSLILVGLKRCLNYCLTIITAEEMINLLLWLF